MATDGRNAKGREEGSAAGRQMRLAARYSAVGIEMGIAVAIGYFIGSWLDDELGTAPWMMILWLLFGFGAATKAVADAVKRAKKDKVV